MVNNTGNDKRRTAVGGFPGKNGSGRRPMVGFAGHGMETKWQEKSNDYGVPGNGKMKKINRLNSKEESAEQKSTVSGSEDQEGGGEKITGSAWKCKRPVKLGEKNCFWGVFPLTRRGEGNKRKQRPH